MLPFRSAEVLNIISYLSRHYFRSLRKMWRGKSEWRGNCTENSCGATSNTYSQNICFTVNATCHQKIWKYLFQNVQNNSTIQSYQDVTTTPQLQINNCQYFGELCSFLLIYLQCFHHMFTAWTLNNVNAAAQHPSLVFTLALWPLLNSYLTHLPWEYEISSNYVGPTSPTFIIGQYV